MFPMLHPTERQPMASMRGGRSLAALWTLMATRTASLRPAPATQRLTVQVGQGQPRGVSIPQVRLLERVTLQTSAWGLLPILYLCKNHTSSGGMAACSHSRAAHTPYMYGCFTGNRRGPVQPTSFELHESRTD